MRDRLRGYGGRFFLVRALRLAALSGVSLSLTSALGACGGGDDVGQNAGALHGAGELPDGGVGSDTTFPSVVSVNVANHLPSGWDGCTGSLLSDNTAILAAHCFPQVAHHCWDSAFQTSLAGTYVALSLDGNGNDFVEYYLIDQVVTHPDSFLNLAACSNGAPNNCNSSGDDSSAGIITGHDLALIHFIVETGQTPPSGHGVYFHQVITSTADSAASVAGTVHVAMDMTTAITSTTNANIVGWGNDDFPPPDPDAAADADAGGYPSLRETGPAQFMNTGSTFGQNCDAWPTCWNVTNDTVNCGGVFGNFADHAFHTQRFGSPGAYTGVVTDHGDSGGPVFLHAGSSTGDVSALSGVAGGPWFQVGVTSGGDLDGLGDGVEIDAGYQSNDWFAATWTPDNGNWIEATLQQFQVDPDGDQIIGSADNCPELPNPDQANTNRSAESVLSLSAAGDVCDPNATGRGTPGGEWNAPISGPCEHVVLSTNGGSTVTTSGSCPLVYNTQITMRGNIGNSAGVAPATTGRTAPSYCDCPYANTASNATCVLSPYNCVIASDAADPNEFVKTTGWMAMTQYSGGGTHAYSFTDLVYQDPSEWEINQGFWTNQDVATDWNYPSDVTAAGHPGASTLTGQIWTHLPPSFFTVPFGSGESDPAVNTPSHYIDFEAQYHNGYSFAPAPGLVNLWVPFWVKVEMGLGPEVPYLLGAPEASGAVDVIAETASGLRMANGRFDTSARSAMVGLARSPVHSADLIVADEGVAGDGGLLATAPRAIITWANDTSIKAALTQQYQLVTGTTTTNSNTMFAPWARAYSATTGKLYALKSVSSTWYLYAFDVASALAGSPTNTSVAITGVTVTAPSGQGMAYDAQDGNLYFLDQVTVGSSTALRLVRLSTTGVATQLWQTAAVTTIPGGYLSTSTTGELVLGLTRPSAVASEVVLLDRNGQPRWSMSESGSLLGRPVANESGISVEHNDPSSGNATPVTLVARSSMSHGLCGTTWLQANVDLTTQGPLGYPAGDCP